MLTHVIGIVAGIEEPQGTKTGSKMQRFTMLALVVSEHLSQISKSRSL